MTAEKLNVQRKEMLSNIDCDISLLIFSLMKIWMLQQ